MRKIIENKTAKTEVKKSNLRSKTEESKMENLTSVYEKMFRRISYLKDRDTTVKLLDFQDALQEVATKIDFNKTVEKPSHYFRVAVKNQMIDNRKKSEGQIENFGESLDDKWELKNGEVFEPTVVADTIVNPQGEVITVLEAIKKQLLPLEFEVFTYYCIEGYTLKEIANRLGYSEAKQIQRILKRSMDKVDMLKVSYFYESKYATYQGKAGKVNAVINSEVVYDEKLKYFKRAPHTFPNEVIKRQYLCLDQSKVKKQYAGTMVNRIANRKEVKIQRAENMKYYFSKEYYFHNTTYDDNKLPEYSYNPTEPYANNKEAMYLYKNRKQYNEMVRSNSIVVKENRYEIHFSNGRYISTDRKFKDIS